MKTITVSQIESVLDWYLEEYKLGKRNKANVLFVAPEGFGTKEAMCDWQDKHSDEIGLREFFYPGVYKEEVNGLLVDSLKDGKVQYSYADTECETVRDMQAVVLFERLNYMRNTGGDDILRRFLDDRITVTITGNEYDLSGLWLAVATAYPDDGLNRILSIEHLIDAFDVYEVKATMSETVERAIKSCEEELRVNELIAKEDPERASRYKENTYNRMAVLEKLKAWPEEIEHTALFTPAGLESALNFAKTEEEFIKHCSDFIYDEKAVELLKKILQSG